jgi:Protein of unknown function (DUF2795)
MDSGNEYHPEQIPTEYNEEQTLRAVRKQSQVPGEHKEKTINDFPKAAAVGQILKDLNFPADKQTIVTFIKKLNSPLSKEILPLIESLNDEKRYENVSDIAKDTGLVE